MNGTVHRLKDRPKRPWRAEYFSPDGRRRSKTFQRKAETERWLREKLAALDRGVWVDPTAGGIAFDTWADDRRQSLSLPRHRPQLPLERHR